MKTDPFRIALLHYSTHNLGDDLQSFAVRQVIHAEHSLDRDKLHEDSSACDLLLYGWLLQSRQWPPLPGHRVHPLSIHVAPRSRALLRRHIDWWRPLGTIPCRDASSAEFFLKHDVPAVFEGCATLSLQRWEEKQTGRVVFVDAESDAGCLPQVDFPEVVHRTHNIRRALRANQAYRQKAARGALEIYQRAELVITSRLHALLPCLAFGTPVVYVPSRLMRKASHYTRFLDYLPYIETWDGKQSYASGGPSPVNYRPTALIQRVTDRLASIRNHLTNAAR